MRYRHKYVAAKSFTLHNQKMFSLHFVNIKHMGKSSSSSSSSNRADWHSSKFEDSYSGVLGSNLDYEICCFYWRSFFQVSLCQWITSIWLRPLPFKSFPIHQSHYNSPLYRADTYKLVSSTSHTGHHRVCSSSVYLFNFLVERSLSFLPMLTFWVGLLICFSECTNHNQFFSME
jgi:hypothetical protein